MCEILTMYAPLRFNRNKIICIFVPGVIIALMVYRFIPTEIKVKVNEYFYKSD